MIQLLEQHCQALLSFLPCIIRDQQKNQPRRIAKQTNFGCFYGRKTPDKYAKINSVYQKFQDYFDQMIMTLHNYETPKEIPNKFSSQNYAIRSVLADLNKTHHHLPKKILFNQFYVDTIFHKTF
ncbi:unnamed protein product [Paramecium pentaurelia]|uniref:Uncharacterized protein n=1 Tax=Paramecium pentaurelia TaxID=43138 RepID=A0A8S1Y5B9_9CILI|nr:unnamed protein product [Paramecium pentaurelia]CAD8209000.1 unnamed protein product [Paramecium pentaurelia]